MSGSLDFPSWRDRLARIGLSMPDMLVPGPDVDLSRWAVNACDQHVHDRSYWDRAEDRIGDDPSALALILPESDLGREDVSRRIRGIHRCMEEYLRAKILRPTGPGFVVVHRQFPGKATRGGLLVGFDLEAWHVPELERFALRPTERLVEDRLPARLSIREGAAIELPHALVLVDDPRGALSETLAALDGRDLYETPLPENAGSVRGAWVRTRDSLEALVTCLESLAAAGNPSTPVWSIGDGNHSLEAARRHWSRLRALLGQTERITHPARHFLAELVPLQSPGLEILPVHRFVHGVPGDVLRRTFEEAGWESQSCNLSELRRDLESDPGRWVAGWTSGDQAWGFFSSAPRPDPFDLVLEGMLRRLQTDFPAARIEYLHGWEEAAQAGLAATAIYFRTPTRQALAQALHSGEIFPPKTFSLGAASDKRHYLEARLLRDSVAEQPSEIEPAQPGRSA